MRIREAVITVEKPAEAARFYRDVLELPVHEEPDRATVTAGASRLLLERGASFRGVHHLAFGISPHDFGAARRWLHDRVDPVVVGGSDVIEGPDGWDSQSVYFLGPEGIVLEYIGRQADAKAPTSSGASPSLLSVSEVGIGVADVGAAVSTLTHTLGLSPFPPQEAHFAPVGDHDGLLIIVDQERLWFPARTDYAARGPISVHIDAPNHKQVGLTGDATITALA